MSIVLLWAAGMADSQATQRPAPVPSENPDTWFRGEDYPESVHPGVQGVSVFTVKVGTDGRVKSCRIIETSGSSDLDIATCDIVTSRASFQPATDKKGTPIEGEYSNSVRWQPPVMFPFHSERSTSVVMIQEKNGVISSCKLKDAQAQDNEQKICEMMKLKFAWPPGHTYEPDRKQIVYTLTEIRDITVVHDDANVH